MRKPPHLGRVGPAARSRKPDTDISKAEASTNPLDPYGTADHIPIMGIIGSYVMRTLPLGSGNIKRKLPR